MGWCKKKNGTSSSNNHVKVCSKLKILRVSEESNQMELVFSSGGDGSLGSWKFDQDAIRKSLVKMIIIDELPFKFVEAKRYRKHMKEACLRFRIPSWWIVARNCYKVYVDEKTHMRKFCRSCLGRICLTTNTWTSVQKINYLRLTAHFIDNDWKLQKKDFRLLSHYESQRSGYWKGNW